MPTETLSIEEDATAATPESLYRGCRQRVRRFLAPRVDELFELAHSTLFARARDASTDDAQQDFFDAMQELHRVREPVESGFLAGVDAAFDAAWSGELGAREQAPDAQADDLALIDTQSLDDQVRVVGIVGQVLPALKGQQFSLNERLSTLLAKSLDDDSSPVSVQGICGAFHDALANLGAQRDTRQALYHGLARSIAGALGPLFDELNDYLAEHDVLPGGPRRVIRKEPDRQPRSREAPDETPRTARPAETRPSKSGDAAPRRRRTAGPGTAAEVPFDGAAASARSLMQLSRAVEAGRADLTDPQRFTGSPGVRDVLDQALAHIQRSGEAADWGTRGPFALEKRIRKALTGYGVTISDTDLADGVDLVSRLFDALLADPLVDAGTHPWLRALAIPVLRVALTDGTFFASDRHPARTALNALCGFAFGNPTRFSPEVILHERASRLVRELNDSPVTPVEAIRGAIEDLEAVQRDQVDHAARNRERAVAEVSDATPAPVAGDAPAATERALAEVASLSTGDVVVLRPADAPPALAELAWLSDDGRRQLLTDRLGRSVRSFGPGELARAVDARSVEVDETVRMAPVDRAMCGVLDRIHDELERKATSDPSTGLATARSFRRIVARALGKPAEPGRHHHLLQLGIDTMEAIVERAGRDAYEKLASQYAAVLTRQVGHQGRMARLSDGVFALLMANTRRSDIEAVVERHRQSVDVARLVHQGEPLPLEVSIGAIGLDPSTTDAETALRSVAVAFRKATGTAGNSVHFPSASSATAPERAQQEEGPSIEALIRDDRLALRAQKIAPIPSVDGATDELPYYEVLLGVRNDAGELRPPGDVVLAAERSGEVPILDRWVLRTALAWMGEHRDWLEGVQGLSINLSGGTLAEPGLADEILALLDTHGVSPDRIMLEVTESAAIGPLASARAFIDTLREKGCRFALDDFGAANASYSYLKLLPVDTVKIDGLFVRDIVSSPTDQAMVRSINDIAQLLGKKTVAEFVEDDAALALLREFGVDYAQGFGIARPVPIDDITD